MYRTSAYQLIAAGSPVDDPEWSNFVEQFVDELSRASSQTGGCATAGALHVAKDFVKGEDWAKPALVGLRDQALKFLIEAGTDPRSIPQFVLARWTELRQQG